MSLYLGQMDRLYLSKALRNCTRAAARLPFSREFRARHDRCRERSMGTRDIKPRKTTLLDLLCELQASHPHSEKALVAVALHMIRSGRVVLCGNYSNAFRTYR
jgi:hypothetical protein